MQKKTETEAIHTVCGNHFHHNVVGICSLVTSSLFVCFCLNIMFSHFSG